jgi:hypothetical protein
MYDVLYLDHAHRQKTVASGLPRQTACDVAREEARRRGVGRMFLAGSEPEPISECVVIVQRAVRPAA